MKYVLIPLIWGTPAFLYIILPLILWIVEIPLMRRLRNYSIGAGWNPCPHNGPHTQTGWFGDRCDLCGVELGDPRGQH